MRLIRIKLENWRGVKSSEISLDEGVTIVEGANEAGKSSFIEALNLLFRERDSTKKQELKRVTPKGIDAGSFVEVELTTGDYHFTYSKMFNKTSATRLLLHAPDVLQLTGVQAHERVVKILDETIDFGLWQAIQLEQGNDFTQVNLKSSDSLAQALDSAAGGSGAGDGEAVLLDKVKSEYLRYYTERTAKETGELARLRTQVVQLEERIELGVQELQSMEQFIERSARLASENQAAQAELPLIQQQLELHQQSQLQFVTLQERKKRIDAQVLTQQLVVSALESKVNDRQSATDRLQKMQSDFDLAKKNLLALEATSQKAITALSDATTDRSRLIENRLKIDDELHVVELESQLRDKSNEYAALSSRLNRIAEAHSVLDEVNKKLSSILIDDKTLVRIENLEQDRRDQEVRLSARSPELVLTALKEIPVEIDGVVQQLSAQQNIRPETSANLRVQISDLATVDLVPASDLEALQTGLTTAESKLKQLLQQCGVNTVGDAAAAQRLRTVLLSQKEGLQLRYRELLEGANEDDLRQRQRELQQKTAQYKKQLANTAGRQGDLLQGGQTAQPDQDSDGLEALQQQLRNRLSAADLELKTVRLAHDDAQSRKAKIDTDLEVARQRHNSDKAAIEQLQKELENDRAVSDDNGLSDQLDKERRLLADLVSAASVARQHEADQQVDDVENLVNNAQAALNRATADLHDIEKERVELRTRLDHLQAEGLHEKLELLRAEHDDASSRLQQLERSARSARCLWSALCRHQRMAQLSYARPLAERVAQMGRLVFGRDFSVQLSESLTIESRTLNRLTVPFEDLSGGAREQLGILLRLAAAQLVSGVRGMPLILDDTLGHTDPDRLETMGAILSNAGRHAQIVVMTCYPRRYGYVGEARVVKLDSGQQTAGTQLQLSGFVEPV